MDAAPVPLGPCATAAHAMVPNLEKAKQEMSILDDAKCRLEAPV